MSFSAAFQTMSRPFQTKQHPSSTGASSSQTANVEAGAHQCGNISTDGGEIDMFMDIKMYQAVQNGEIEHFLRALNRISSELNTSHENILDRVSHAGNTVAHVAAKHEKEDIICHIATNFSYLIFQKNSDGDTVLHIASRNGYLSIVKALLPELGELLNSPSQADYVAAKNNLARKKNKRGNTALHEALSNDQKSVVALSDGQKPIVALRNDQKSVAALRNDQESVAVLSNDQERVAVLSNDQESVAVLSNDQESVSALSNQELIALYLIQQDPELSYYQNKEGETGFYLAAKAGYAKCISSMLKDIAIDQKHINQLFKKKSPIKAAIFNNNKGVLEAMLNSKPCLIHLRDGEGSTPLHYAASAGFIEMVRYLIEKYSANITQRDNKGLCPIHLASIKGHVNIIILLHQYYPAPAELLDRYGRNILHLAASNGRYNVVKYILHEHDSFEEFINMKDADGNTLSKHGFEELINMKDVDGNTPLHLATMGWHPKIVSAFTWDKRVDLKLVNKEGMTALDFADSHMGKKNQFRKRLTRIALQAAGTPRDLSGKFVTTIPTKHDDEKSHKERINTLLLVATLVATVTYAAGFTLPGGNNSAGTDLGRATMLRERGFHVFVLCDSIAMYCSIIIAVALIFAQLGDVNMMITVVHLALPLLGVALCMMSMAFTAGVFLVVSRVGWVSIAVFVMGLSFLATLLALLFPLCIPFSSSNRILRNLSYYPFHIAIIASKSLKFPDSF